MQTSRVVSPSLGPLVGPVLQIGEPLIFVRQAAGPGFSVTLIIG